MTTEKIVKEHNLELKKKLIPDVNEPIFCNSFLDPNDEVYQQSLESLTIIKK
jgi:hypothetical protein